ncbi:hypothetical protein OG618_37290 (plasmid) [Kitasatospora sp. NBC_01246]|uniref:hypothetical protein n=1 Tax=Kitasatospora sp. NBC_01246 TaxID=2903570 RepID=UPI002E380997|nr:hypothetical protein [Kitasatospora sp. NBC_01246]
MSHLTTDQLNRFRHVLARPWSRWTPTGRAAHLLLADAEDHTARQSDLAALADVPTTVVALEPDRARSANEACSMILSAVLAGRLHAPLTVTAGRLAVRVTVRPETTGQWEKWRAAVGARAGDVTHLGHYSTAKGARCGAPVVLVGYGVSALYSAALRTGR